MTKFLPNLPFAAPITLPQLLASVEREKIIEALQQTQWNYTEASKLLGITYRSMRHRCESLGIGGKDMSRPYFRDKPKTSKFARRWPSLRMEILKRDGARCVACGATPAHGARLHVDHIKPKGKFPELALEPENMQVLCDQCNITKGSKDETNWKTLSSVPVAE